MRSEDDYRRFAGRLAKVVVSEAVDNQKAFEGRLRGVDGSDVLLEAPNGRCTGCRCDSLRAAGWMWSFRG